MKKTNTFIVDLVNRMSLDQKVGALFTLGFTGAVPKKNIYDYITKYHCGGLRLTPRTRMFGSYVDPRSNKEVVKVTPNNGIKYPTPAPVASAADYKKVLNELQEIAQSRPLSLPLHFSYDQEGGSSADFLFGNVNVFPKPMGLRATGDKKLAYLVGKAIAEQSRNVGFNYVHSPVLDINLTPDNPEIGDRAYSDNAEAVLEYARETCRGLKEGGVIATGKHFPGRGFSGEDAHFNVPTIDVDRKTMFERELMPYIKLIEEDLLPSIMIAHSIFPAFDTENIATVSRKILTGLLREEMGFQGVITTDSMTMGGVATRHSVPEACALSLQAGADLVLLKAENELVPDTLELVKSFVNEGKIPMEELDDKVYRVLNLKHQYGMFYSEYESAVEPEDVFSRPDIMKLAKRVAKKSVLIARGEQNFPLNKEEKVLVIEQKSDKTTFRWHSGMLFEQCEQLGANVDYLETANRYDDADIYRIKEALPKYSTIIITNYFGRTSLSNKEVVEEILDGYEGKVVIVTNRPYEELSIPVNAENVVVTFATTPDNIEVVAGTIFGKVYPEGVWPIEYKLPAARSLSKTN